MWRHPKYYKELRKLRNKLDQSISTSGSTERSDKRSTGPGPKPQAASSVILEPRYKNTEEVFLGKGPRAFTMIKVLLG